MAGSICKNKDKLLEIRNYTKGFYFSGNTPSYNYGEPLVAYLLGNMIGSLLYDNTGCMQNTDWRGEKRSKGPIKKPLSGED